MKQQGSIDARGSEWHRWDPHIHAPGTVLEDGFAGDWESYLDKLESADPPIRALGVTDYLSIQTYKDVVSHKKDGRLPNVDLIFPNVEMRLDTKTAKGKGINLHLLFCPDDSEHVPQIERALSQLTFEYQGQPYRCTDDDLAALGRKFKPTQTDARGARAEGVNQFKVSFAELRKLLRDNKWLRTNCLIAVASSRNDGTAGLQEDSAFAATREEIERLAHIIFSGNPNDQAFWLGEKALDPLAIENRYGSLKPCLHGCDAHQLDRVGAPDLMRCCWIKGDITFESLRQAAIEPGERVRIADCSPALSADSVTIRTVRPIAMPWLGNELIPLNRGLVSIIGARGSGKTALADMIAAGASALGTKLGESSFLRRATSPVDMIGDGSVELEWADGERKSISFAPPDAWSAEPPEVRYLSQQFVDQLCSSAGLAVELREEIERVIFDQTDPADRYDTDSFAALKTLLLDPIRRRREQWVGSIKSYSEKVADETRLRDRLPKLKADRALLAQQIEKARKDLQALLPKGTIPRHKRWLEVESACTAAEGRLELLRRREKSLDDLRDATKYIRDEESVQRLSNLREQFADAGLTDDEWANFREVFKGDVEEAVTRTKKIVARAVEVLQRGDPANPMDIATTPLIGWPLVQLRAEREKIKKELGFDAAQQKKYDALKLTITNNEVTLKRLDATIQAGVGVVDRITDLRARRQDAYRELVATFVEEQDVLAKLYGPLQEQLVGAEGALSKLRFAVRRQVRLEEWVTRGEALLDLRKASAFQGQGTLATIAKRHVLTAWRTGNADTVAKQMHDFLTTHRDEILKASPTFAEPSEKTEWLRRIADWIFSTDHIEIHYAIEYEGVSVEQLSPGTRGIVLLLLYLVIDRTDRRPLLIDQPEENLDPKSVFEDLVPHFRQARHRRQVIIVTHNANLVVNTDADQVIVATSAPAKPDALPRISYESGSLENPEIRLSVCEILEGGHRAFLERERRYRLQWEHIRAEAERAD